MSETPKFDFRGANIGNFAESVQGDQKSIQHIYATEQNLAEAANEIQQLLAQLATNNPVIVESNNQTVALNALHQEIQQNPTLKKRLLNALKAGGVEALSKALEAIFNTPAVSIPVATVKAFIEAE